MSFLNLPAGRYLEDDTFGNHVGLSNAQPIRTTQQVFFRDDQRNASTPSSSNPAIPTLNSDIHRTSSTETDPHSDEEEDLGLLKSKTSSHGSGPTTEGAGASQAPRRRPSFAPAGKPRNNLNHARRKSSYVPARIPSSLRKLPAVSPTEPFAFVLDGEKNWRMVGVRYLKSRTFKNALKGTLAFLVASCFVLVEPLSKIYGTKSFLIVLGLTWAYSPTTMGGQIRNAGINILGLGVCTCLAGIASYAMNVSVLFYVYVWAVFTIYGWAVARVPNCYGAYMLGGTLTVLEIVASSKTRDEKTDFQELLGTVLAFLTSMVIALFFGLLIWPHTAIGDFHQEIAYALDATGHLFLRTMHLYLGNVACTQEDLLHGQGSNETESWKNEDDVVEVRSTSEGRRPSAFVHSDYGYASNHQDESRLELDTPDFALASVRAAVVVVRERFRKLSQLLQDVDVETNCDQYGNVIAGITSALLHLSAIASCTRAVTRQQHKSAIVPSAVEVETHESAIPKDSPEPERSVEDAEFLSRLGIELKIIANSAINVIAVLANGFRDRGWGEVAKDATGSIDPSKTNSESGLFRSEGVSQSYESLCQTSEGLNMARLRNPNHRKVLGRDWLLGEEVQNKMNGYLLDTLKNGEDLDAGAVLINYSFLFSLYEFTGEIENIHSQMIKMSQLKTERMQIGRILSARCIPFMCRDDRTESRYPETVRGRLWSIGRSLKTPEFRSGARLGLLVTFLVASGIGQATREWFMTWHGEWVITTILAVSAPSYYAGEVVSSMHRAIGTVLGALAALFSWYIFDLGGGTVGLFCTTFLLVFPAFHVREYPREHAKSAMVGLLTYVIVLLGTNAMVRDSWRKNDQLPKDEETFRQLWRSHIVVAVYQRLIMVLFGLALALLAGRLLWPNLARSRLRKCIAITLSDTGSLFANLMTAFLCDPSGSQHSVRTHSPTALSAKFAEEPSDSVDQATLDKQQEGGETLDGDVQSEAMKTTKTELDEFSEELGPTATIPPLESVSMSASNASLGLKYTKRTNLGSALSLTSQSRSPPKQKTYDAIRAAYLTRSVSRPDPGAAHHLAGAGRKLAASRIRAKALVMCEELESKIQLDLLEDRDMLILARDEPRLEGPFNYPMWRAILRECQIIADRLLSTRAAIIHAGRGGGNMDAGYVMLLDKERRDVANAVLLLVHVLYTSLVARAPLPSTLPDCRGARRRFNDRLVRHVLENAHSMQLTKANDNYYIAFFAFSLAMTDVICHLDELTVMIRQMYGESVSIQCPWLLDEEKGERIFSLMASCSDRNVR